MSRIIFFFIDIILINIIIACDVIVNPTEYAELGENIILDCGNIYEDQFVWTRDDVEICSTLTGCFNDRYSVTIPNYNMNNLLSIKNVEESDFGVYRCITSNCNYYERFLVPNNCIIKENIYVIF
ncbi:putative immunoglobulin-like domain containing protein [Namao virus]|nr:putative immunoglobulin-like domain containing protein [Namao virus]